MAENYSTLVPVGQWDPIQVLDINQKPDGNFTCSGVKNNTDIRCGYNLRGETAARISNMIDDVASLPPRTAVPYLRALADVSLCQYHKIQARNKAIEWTAAVERLSRSIAPPPITTSQLIPPPPQRPTMTPLSTPSRSSESSSSQLSPESRNRYPSVPPTADVERKKRQLRSEIEALTKELAMLETRDGDEGDVSNVTAPRNVSKQPSSRTSLKSAFGFGRRIS
jgi:hypothetical protein